MPPHKTDIISVTTSDDYVLPGVYLQPLTSGSTVGNEKFDLLIYVPGSGDDVLNPSFFDQIIEHALSRGISVLKAGTRGRGIISVFSSSKGPKVCGTAFELVSDCLIDLSAWFAWAKAQEFTSVCLCGHSLGAIKVLYFSSKDRDPSLKFLFAVSPPRLSRAGMLGSSVKEKFGADIAAAESAIRDNEPRKIITVSTPMKLITSALSYADKYGSEKYNLVHFHAEIKIPTLLTFAGREPEKLSFFEGWHEEVKEIVKDRKNLRSVIFSTADHYYKDHVTQLNAAFQAWFQ